jgi:hypothetical protein
LQGEITLDTDASPGLLVIDGATGAGDFLQPGNTLQAAKEIIGPVLTFNQTGGTNSVGQFIMTATYNLQDGQLEANGETIQTVPLGPSGYSAGQFTQSGVTSEDTVNGVLIVGAGGPSYVLGIGASYDLQGGLLSVGYEGVGENSLGTLSQEGGENDAQGLTLGALYGGSGIYDLNGGSLSVKGEEVVGQGGMGEFQQKGGRHTVGSSLILGAQNGGSGTYTLEGTGTLYVGYDEGIGFLGLGSFTQNGETRHTAAIIHIGRKGEYHLMDGALLGNIVNANWFAFSGGHVSGDVINNVGAQFFVLGGGVRLMFGNFTNNGTLNCAIGTSLHVFGEFINNGKNDCVIIH